MGKIKALEGKKEEANDLIRQISGLDKCPTCLQQVSINYKDDMLNNAKKEIDIVDNKIQIENGEFITVTPDLFTKEISKYEGVFDAVKSAEWIQKPLPKKW